MPADAALSSPAALVLCFRGTATLDNVLSDVKAHSVVLPRTMLPSDCHLDGGTGTPMVRDKGGNRVGCVLAVCVSREGGCT